MLGRRIRSARGLAASVVAVAMAFTGVLATAPASSADPDKVAAAADELDRLQMQAEAALEKLNGATIELERLTDSMAAAQRRVDAAKREVSATQDIIGRIAATTYRSGGVDASLQLLLADSPQDFLMQAATLDQVAASQATALRRTQTARLRLAQAVNELEQQKAAQADAVASIDGHKQELEAAVAAQSNVLATLQEEERQRLEELRRKRIEAAKKAAEEAARKAAEQRAAEEAARKAAEEEARRQAEQQAQQQNNGGGGSGGGNNGTGTSDTGGPGSGSEGGSGGGGGGSTATSGAARIAVDAAMAQLGEPYTYNAQPPNTWDCSKLTAWAWGQAGVYLTAYSYAQANEVQRISTSDLRPGDILFYFEQGAHHVGLYLGGGQMIHAANPELGVIISDIYSPWYQSHFSFAGRPYS